MQHVSEGRGEFVGRTGEFALVPRANEFAKVAVNVRDDIYYGASLDHEISAPARSLAREFVKVLERRAQRV